MLVLRVAINPDTVQRFTVSAKQIEPPPQPVSGEPAPQSHRQITYNIIGQFYYIIFRLSLMSIHHIMIQIRRSLKKYKPWRHTEILVAKFKLSCDTSRILNLRIPALKASSSLLGLTLYIVSRYIYILKIVSYPVQSQLSKEL